MDLPVIGHDRHLFGQVSMLNVTARVGVALPYDMVHFYRNGDDGVAKCQAVHRMI